MRGLPYTTSLEDELQALWQGLKIALEHNSHLYKSESDSEQVLRMLNKGNLHYNSIIFECKSLMEQLENPALGHNFRELNRVADLLAKEGADMKLFDRTEILTAPPVFVNKAL
ncbi:hypothetical protein A4A49_55117 [Nicotiana attenuata]|uniref:RNase H type-1 domain-containing protein n=1 Tax=Nicotiana attenuata TaxID=49451 RepID=A0A314L7P3_NICAT|nr:hypothetical protein A4A49_55117 [Nicotiana attenuata]